MKHTDFNSAKNQEIKSQFIQKEVYCNVNSMVEYILGRSHEDDKAPFSYDDISNLMYYPETILPSGKRFEGGAEDDKKTFIQKLQDVHDESEDIELRTHIQSDIDFLENLDSEYRDVFEWWVVSSWFAEELKKQGEVIIEGENIWGRSTTGQAILLDSVVSLICEGIEILDGMKNSWAK
jgi:hypothetical protein